MSTDGRNSPSMPEYVPGLQGQSLRVVPAILKRDERAPSFTGPNPFGRRRVEPGIIVRCGYASRGCRGVLGYAMSRYAAFKRAYLPLLEIQAERPDAWCLEHPDKYRGNRTTGYTVLDPEKGRRSKGGEKIGARSGPSPHRVSDEAVRGFQPGPRRVVGQFPELPCVVFCPNCHAPNWVEPPGFDSPPLIGRPLRS